MGRLGRISCVLSGIAVAVFVVLVLSNGNTEPWPALALLRIAAIVTSAVAGLVGLVTFVVLDRRGRPGAAWAVGGLAAIAGLPAFSVVWHFCFPSLD